MRRILSLVGAGILFFASGASYAGDTQELDRLCAANRAAVEAIRTLQCRVTIDGSAWGIPGGEYWRSGKAVRMHWSERTTQYYAVIRDGIVRVLVKQEIDANSSLRQNPEVRDNLEGGKYYWHAAIERHNGGSHYSFDPWLAAHCVTSDGGIGGNVSLQQFADNHRKEFQGVRKVTEDAVTTVALDFQLPGALCTIYLDSAANHLVRTRARKSQAVNGYSSQSEVASFREVAPGIYFPEKVTVKRVQGGKALPDETITFHNVAINKPIASSTFELKFKNGIELTNRIEGTKYRVNENGEPIGPKSPMNVGRPLPVTPTQSGKPGTESREESAPWGSWILPGSVGLLFITLAIVLVRRRRAAMVAE